VSSQWLSWYYVFAGELQEGEGAARAAIEGMQRLGDDAGLAEGLAALASALSWSGRYDEVWTVAQERRRVFREMGRRDCFGTLFLSLNSMHQGHYDVAHRFIDEALLVAHEIDAGQLIADSLLQRAFLRVAEGAISEAVRLSEEAISTYWRIGQEQSVRVGQCVLALAALGQGDGQQAQEHLWEAAQTALARKAFPTLVYTLPVAALLILDTGRTARAVEVWASACTMACVANSRWFQDVVGGAVIAAAESLPTSVLAQARRRGRAGGGGIVADLNDRNAGRLRRVYGRHPRHPTWERIAGTG
jgi:hypothetical protein